MENMKKQGIAKPEKVLDGESLGQDIGQLIGYVHSIGIQTGERGIFPSEHFAELMDLFMRKYRTLDGQDNPKKLSYNAHQIKRLVEEHRYLSKTHRIASAKLSVHEHYMDIQKRLNGRTDCMASDGEYTADVVEKIAASMEKEASEYMDRPESFDDIADDWTSTGSGTSKIQERN